MSVEREPLLGPGDVEERCAECGRLSSNGHFSNCSTFVLGMTIDDDHALRRGTSTALSVLMQGLKFGIGPHYRNVDEWLELATTLEEQARIIRDVCVAFEKTAASAAQHSGDENNGKETRRKK